MTLAQVVDHATLRYQLPLAGAEPMMQRQLALAGDMRGQRVPAFQLRIEPLDHQAVALG